MSAIPVIFLMGPTATGKTDLACKIFDEFPCEIVSVDSVMIYRGMDVGSAKPELQTLEKYPHHLIDILDPSEAYSVANFRVDALRLIQEINQRGKTPLLVGGTMLYFSALLRGLANMPKANPRIRERMNQLAAEKGWEFLHARLKEVDPQAAERIHPNDPQRIQRALEVYELSGIPISEWHATPSKMELPFNPLKLALIHEDRKLLHLQIEKRFDQMLEKGFMQEMLSFYQREDLHDDLPAMRSIGYRQAWQYLAGKYDLATMREKAIIATRQLAKRQLTWLRRESNLISYPVERYKIHDVCHEICSHLA